MPFHFGFQPNAISLFFSFFFPNNWKYTFNCNVSKTKVSFEQIFIWRFPLYLHNPRLISRFQMKNVPPVLRFDLQLWNFICCSFFFHNPWSFTTIHRLNALCINTLQSHFLYKRQTKLQSNGIITILPLKLQNIFKNVFNFFLFSIVIDISKSQSFIKRKNKFLFTTKIL